MGVSLERVQNKFACIIGELCSEPLVLSQFAVWLDLRLAEYKAKGSICLECCGDIPSPIWLKGLPLKSQANQDESWPPTSFTHSPDLRRSDQSGDTHPPSSAIMEDRPPWQRQNFTQSPHRTSSSKLPYQQHNTDHSPFRSSIPTGRSPATQRNHGTKAQSQHSPVTLATNSATERLYSPSTQTISSPLDCSQPIGMVGPTDMSEVVIKQEIVDDEPEIVPISLHVHENIQDDSRKRIFSDMEDNGVTGTHSPNKHKKIASTENSAALSMTSPLTQDLSSIIGLQDQNEESLASDNIESDVTIMAYDTIKTDGDDSDIEEISQHGDSSLHPFTLHTQTALQNRDLDFSSIQTDNDSKLSRHSQSGDWTGQSTAEPGTSFGTPAVHETRSSSCPICGKGFSMRKNLKRHMESHSIYPSSFRCEVCQKVFSRGDSLKRHLLTHSKDF